MKKGKMLIASLLVLFTMTGCGSKTLTCTSEYKESGVEMGYSISAKFKSDKLNSMKVSVDVTLPENLMSQKQTMIDTMKDTKEIENAKITETKDGFKVEGIANAKELGTDNNASYDDVKKTLEAAGYKCK